jgi:hypothetical protein
MSADIVNITDDIHPQYSSFKMVDASQISVALADGQEIWTLRYMGGDPGLVISDEYAAGGNVALKTLAVAFTKSELLDFVTLKCLAVVSGTSSNCFINSVIESTDDNGTITVVDTGTDRALGGTFATISLGKIDISSIPTGDIVKVYIKAKIQFGQNSVIGVKNLHADLSFT